MQHGKLGKKAVRHDPRTLKLARYTAALADPPTECNLTGKITDLGMMLNDALGDCTCASIGHMVQAWTAEDGAQVIIADADIEKAYEAFCGYRPGDPSTDQGGIELDVLNGWRQVGVAGHQITAYAALQVQPAQSAQPAPESFWKKLKGLFGKKAPRPRAMLPVLDRQLKQGVYYFGGVYIGVELPLTAQGQATWDVVSLDGDGERGSWGGHAIPIVGYDSEYFYVITWGAIVKVTPAFLAEYMSEAYVCFSNDIVGADGKSPQGLETAVLLTDLSEVTA
jgi:hypothetical protein